MNIVWITLAGFLSCLINTSAGGGGEFVFILAVTSLKAYVPGLTRPGSNRR